MTRGNLDLKAPGTYNMITTTGQKEKMKTYASTPYRMI